MEFKGRIEGEDEIFGYNEFIQHLRDLANQGSNYTKWVQFSLNMEGFEDEKTQSPYLFIDFAEACYIKEFALFSDKKTKHKLTDVNYTADDLLINLDNFSNFIRVETVKDMTGPTVITLVLMIAEAIRFEVVQEDVFINLTTWGRPGIRFNGLIDKLVKNWDNYFNKKYGVTLDEIVESPIEEEVKEYYSNL